MWRFHRCVKKKTTGWREGRRKSWPSLLVHAPPFPLYLLSFFVLYSFLSLCLISSLFTSLLPVFALLLSSSDGSRAEPSRQVCGASNCMRACVWVCKTCFKVLSIFFIFFHRPHCVCVFGWCMCVLAVKSVCVGRYLVSSGESRAISTVCCSQPAQKCINDLLSKKKKKKPTLAHANRYASSPYLSLVNIVGVDRLEAG